MCFKNYLKSIVYGVFMYAMISTAIALNGNNLKGEYI
jgi:hypothetical protein